MICNGIELLVGGTSYYGHGLRIAMGIARGVARGWQKPAPPAAASLYAAMVDDNRIYLFGTGGLSLVDVARYDSSCRPP